MWVSVGNVMCRVMRASDDELEWVRQYLSFSEGKWSTKGKRVTLYSSKTKTFPGGLLPLLRDAAAREGRVVEVMDQRVPRIEEDLTADIDWLRDYQREAINACCVHKRGIVKAPTGSGKGDMIVALTLSLPGRWLFLVHRDGLVEQQARRYKKIVGREPNVLSRTHPGYWKVVRGLNLMTLQSFAAGLRADRDAVDKALSDVDGVAIDECHVAPADVYFAAIQRCPAEYRLGFSGTPLDRTDNRSLMAIAAMGRVIYSIRASELIDRGVLAAPRVRVLPWVHGEPTGKRHGRESAYQHAYRELIVESEGRNALVAEAARAAPKPCMVFVKAVEHGKDLQRQIEVLGPSCEFVWGSTAGKVRDAAVERLVRGDTEVIVASVVFQEGLDAPNLASVIVASGGKSVIAALQRIGRGMRSDGGRKSHVDVVDVLDRGGHDSFEMHSRRRMNTYVREGYETVIEQADGTTKPYAPRLRTRGEKRGAR